MQELGREGKSHTAKPEGIPEKINQRQRVDMYVLYLRTYLAAPGFLPSVGSDGSPKPRLLLPASCLSERRATSHSRPGQRERERASDLGPWLPGRVMEEAPLVTAVVRRRMGPPDRALSRIPGVPEDQRALSDGFRVGKKVDASRTGLHDGQIDGSCPSKTSDGRDT